MPDAARISGPARTEGEIVRVVYVHPRNLSIIAEQRVVLVIAGPDQERRFVSGGSGDERVGLLADIGISRVPVPGVHFGSAEVFLENNVHNTRHRIGTVECGGPVLEYLDAFDGGQRNCVNVHVARSDQLIGGDPSPVYQNESATGDIAQPDGGRAVAAVAAGIPEAGVTRNCRDNLDELLDVAHACFFNCGSRVNVNWSGRDRFKGRNQRAGHHDWFHGGWGIGLLRQRKRSAGEHEDQSSGVRTADNKGEVFLISISYHTISGVEVLD